MSEVKTVTESGFKQEVLDSALPVIVDFFAPWCGPCRAFAPALDGIARNYSGRLNVVKVNVDESQELASRFRIRGVPTLMIFKAGKAVDTIVGLPAPETLRKKLDEAAA